MITTVRQTPTAAPVTMDDRNFRFGYYEKVGFGGICEERKTLEILLREHPKPPDLLPRLSYLTSRYSLSAIHRKHVYQLLLDVISPDARITESRIEVQRQISRDIMDALEVMSLVKPSLCKMDKLDFSPDGHPRLLVLIFLFQTKQLEVDVSYQFAQVEVEDLLCISDVFTKEFLLKNTPYSLEDSYWIYKHFLLLVENHLSNLLETYDKFIQNLAKEDHQLYSHLVKNRIIRKAAEAAIAKGAHSVASNGSGPISNAPVLPAYSLSSSSTYRRLSLDRKRNQQRHRIHTERPMVTLFVRFFAGIVHHTYLIRVFDKLIGCVVQGQKQFDALISVGNALITHRRDELLKLDGPEDLTKCLLTPLSFDDSEEIVIDALSNY